MKNKIILIYAAAAVALLIAVAISTFAQTAEPKETKQERIVIIPTLTLCTIPERDADRISTIQLCEYFPMPTPTQRLINGKRITSAEREMLARIIQAEAETEGLKGKALVVCVIFNRCEYKHEFANTIEGVIFEKGQFSPVKPGCRYWTVTPDAECYEAIDMVLNGWDESHGALYFEGCKNPDNWHSRTLRFLFKYGTHRFYKYK